MRTAAGRTAGLIAKAATLAVVPVTVLAVVLAGQAVGVEPTATPEPTASAPATPAQVPATPTTIPIPIEPTPAPTSDATPAPVAPTEHVIPTEPVIPAEATTPAEPVASVEAAPPRLALGTIPGPAQEATYLAPGAPLTGALPFATLRVRALVVNVADAPHDWTPQVEYRRVGQADFVALPPQATPGSPLHATQEWVAADGGTVAAPETTPLTTAILPAPEGVASADGQRTSGANPAAPRTIPARTAVEHEFTVRLSVSAEFGASYEVRVTDLGAEVPGLGVVRIDMATAAPMVAHDGGTGMALSPTFPLSMSRSLTVVSNDPGTVGAGGTPSIHQPGGSTTTGQCATCHSPHRAKGASLTTTSDQSQLCYTCHGGAGMGGPADVASQIAAAKPNDPDNRVYYSHDMTAGEHVGDTRDEFGGQLNRHSRCTDCHNPHDLGKAGALTASGVSVTNGPAGTSPTYQRLDGRTQPITAEYQLCLKCHSTWTEQLPNDPAKPSRDRTDLGVALNPENASYHPVEAPGKNQSRAMADSLSGTSPFKLWDLKPTDTISCTMCHTSSTATAATIADAGRPVHASENRGILVRPYENRVLSVANEAYNRDAFALCLTCHAEAGFRPPYSASAPTNFDWHSFHVGEIRNVGSVEGDIDTAKAGMGNARCAECHFRSHGPSDVPGDQQLDGSGLVVFSPNVTPSTKVVGSKVTFTKTATGGSCTLTCHGKDHGFLQYTAKSDARP